MVAHSSTLLYSPLFPLILPTPLLSSTSLFPTPLFPNVPPDIIPSIPYPTYGSIGMYFCSIGSTYGGMLYNLKLLESFKVGGGFMNFR